MYWCIIVTEFVLNNMHKISCHIFLEKETVKQKILKKKILLEAKAHTKLVHNISDSINSYPKKK